MIKTPPHTPEQLFMLLNKLGINHQTINHPPVFSAHDHLDWAALTPDTDMGLDCKNLFVENKTGQRWLVTMPSAHRADMNAIGKQLGSGRLSFCKPETMLPVLGVPPGHATPFALLNTSPAALTIGLDQRVVAADKINIHPLHNAASTIISGADLLKFLAHLGFKPVFIDASPFTAAAAI